MDPVPEVLTGLDSDADHSVARAKAPLLSDLRLLIYKLTKTVFLLRGEM